MPLSLLLGAKMLTKFVGVCPVTRLFRAPVREATYTTLLMSTGLTFGSIAALFGLGHRIVSRQQRHRPDADRQRPVSAARPPATSHPR